MLDEMPSPMPPTGAPTWLGVLAVVSLGCAFVAFIVSASACNGPLPGEFEVALLLAVVWLASTAQTVNKLRRTPFGTRLALASILLLLTALFWVGAVRSLIYNCCHWIRQIIG